MPKKPKRPCTYPGCPNLADGMFCENHAALAEKERLERQRRYNRYERDRKIIKKYDRRWRKIREAYISAHPLCEICAKNGKTIAAEEVHHIKPLKWGGTHDFNNLMSLCQSCHTKLEREIGNR